MLKSWRTLNARVPQGVLGSQGRLSTPAELMGWFTTPALNSAESVKTVPLWHVEQPADTKALNPRCCAAVSKNRLTLNLFGSVPAGNSCARMNASMAASSSGVGSRKSGSDPPAVPIQRPREVLGDGSRRERLQVGDAAAKPKRTKSMVQVQEMGRLAEHVRVGKPVDVFQDETTPLRKAHRGARPHPLRIFQAERRRTCNSAQTPCRDAH